MPVNKKENPVTAKFLMWIKGWAVPSTGSGWDNILLELLGNIEKLLDERTIPRECFQVLQIKEKFANLRFYFSFDYPEDIDDNTTENLWKQIDGFVTEAEKKASKTCEACGNPGVLRGGGWLKTLCDNCTGREPCSVEDTYWP